MDKKLEERIKKENIKLIVLDSDGVLIPRGTDISSGYSEGGLKHNLTVSTWVVTDRLAEKLNKLKQNYRVCICSGRSMIYLEEMYSKVVGGNTILSAENGNLLFLDDLLVQPVKHGEKYLTKIRKIRDDAKDLDIKGFEPKQFILTIHAEREVMEVYDIVKKYDPEGELKVMWNGEAFDIQKKDMSKAVTIDFLVEKLNLKREEIIAIGDRVNDKEMVEAAGIGVTADKTALEADYYIDEGSDGELPGETLVDMLLNK